MAGAALGFSSVRPGRLAVADGTGDMVLVTVVFRCCAAINTGDGAASAVLSANGLVLMRSYRQAQPEPVETVFDDSSQTYRQFHAFSGLAMAMNAAG